MQFKINSIGLIICIVLGGNFCTLVATEASFDTVSNNSSHVYIFIILKFIFYQFFMSDFP